MIDFACRQFVIDDIIKCSLGLTKAELAVFKHVSSHEDTFFTTEKIAKQLSLDISTAQRAVKKLHEEEVVIRHQENLLGGGYMFSYQVVAHAALEKKMMGILHSWLGRVKQSLQEWP